MKQPIKSALVLGAGVFAVVGLVLAPAAANAVTGNTTVNANVQGAISIATDTTVDLNITPTVSGSATSDSDAVVVTTNNSGGYTLQISAGAATLDKGADTLAATSGTLLSSATLDNNAWGFRYDDADGTYTDFGDNSTAAQSNQANLANTWAAVPTTDSTIKVTGTAATSGDTTDIFYGAKVDTSKPSGTYTGTITYTATTN